MVTTYFTIEGVEPLKSLKFFDRFTAEALLVFFRKTVPDGCQSATIGEYRICGLGGEVQPNLLAA
jgi:hypothetical protein